MKIYTKTGDKGETSLFGGQRVSKDDKRIEAYGTVDELNSLIGTARAFNEDREIETLLLDVQDRLFVLGADLATPPETRNVSIPRISGADVTSVEKSIDELEMKLEPLKNFILPGGTKTASLLHLARTLCRRAERCTVSLRNEGGISAESVVFLNRLSDYLFVLGRFANKSAGVAETPWTARPGNDDRS